MNNAMLKRLCVIAALIAAILSLPWGGPWLIIAVVLLAISALI